MYFSNSDAYKQNAGSGGAPTFMAITAITPGFFANCCVSELDHAAYGPYVEATRQSIELDGTDGHVTGPITSSMENMANQDLSISFWFRIKTFDVTSPKTRILELFDNANENVSVYIQNSDTVRAVFEVTSGNFYSRDTSTSLAVDTWYHMVLTWDHDTTTFKMYLNGTEEGTTGTNNDGSGSSTINTIFLGRKASGSQYFDGFIDEFAAWDETILSSAEVTEIYNSGVGGFDLSTDSGDYASSAGLSLWWDFQSTLPNSEMFIYDKTGNFRDGTVSGGVTYSTTAP